MKSPRGVRKLPSEPPSWHLEAEGDDKWENKVYHRISQVGRDKDPGKDHASPTPSATSSTKNEVTFPPWGTTSITHGMWDAGYPTRSNTPAQLLLQRQEMPPASLGELDTESFCKAQLHLLRQPMHPNGWVTTSLRLPQHTSSSLAPRTDGAEGWNSKEIQAGEPHLGLQHILCTTGPKPSSRLEHTFLNAAPHPQRHFAFHRDPQSTQPAAKMKDKKRGLT